MVRLRAKRSRDESPGTLVGQNVLRGKITLRAEPGPVLPLKKMRSIFFDLRMAARLYVPAVMQLLNVERVIHLIVEQKLGQEQNVPYAGYRQ